MDIGNPYIIVLGISCVIIVSYFFSEIARRTNIPSVLLLILLGIGIKEYLEWKSVETGPQLFSLLKVLGIVGLIMIVLEAALDLPLTKEKRRSILSAFLVAFLTLAVTSFGLAYALYLTFSLDLFSALVYAIPLSVLSSAIVIPSVAHLSNVKKEFLVYEATFSDILGILLFNIALSNTGGGSALSITGEAILTLGSSIVLALVISYALIVLFQRINSNIKLFFLISVLVALYAAAEMLNLSALVIILLFGLVLKNEHVFFRGRLQGWVKPDVLSEIVDNFHVVTRESAFVVRTLFFVVFGMTLTISTLIDLEVALFSLGVLVGIYLIRYLTLVGVGIPSIKPELFVSPRGLVTILLFFAIPPELHRQAFDPAIVLFVVVGTNLVMTYGLVFYGKETAWVSKLKFDDWEAMDREIEALQERKKDTP